MFLWSYMLFSKTCEYGLQAMIYLAVEGRKIGINEISQAQDLPSYYLSKILQNLVKAKLLESAKGPNGGFWIEKPLSEIRLSMIIDSIDRMDSLQECGLGLKTCDSANPCAIHHQFERTRENIINIFVTTSLQDIVNRYENGECVINIS